MARPEEFVGKNDLPVSGSETPIQAQAGGDALSPQGEPSVVMQGLYDEQTKAIAASMPEKNRQGTRSLKEKDVQPSHHDHRGTNDQESEAKASLRHEHSRAVKCRELESGDILNERKEKIPSRLREQIDLIRKNDEYRCGVKRRSMDDWRPAQLFSDLSDPVISAYYSELPLSYATTDRKDGVSARDRPHRVVIHSHFLGAVLKSVLPQLESTPLVLAAPYKLLCKFKPQIEDACDVAKQELNEMEGYFSDSRNTMQGTGVAPALTEVCGMSPVEPELSSEIKYHSLKLRNQHRTDTKAKSEQPGNVSSMKRRQDLMITISHTELLLKFIETDLRHYLHLQETIEKGSINTIAFEDLWYLFAPGDIVIDNKIDRWHLYRVYATTGAQQRRRDLTSRESDGVFVDNGAWGRQTPASYSRNDHVRSWNESLTEDDDPENDLHKDTRVELSGRGTWSPFMIDCMVMEFDGTVVGPGDRSHRIRHFEGEKKIAELSVFPLRFHEKQDEITTALVERGRKLINSYGHKEYNGHTCPRSKGKRPEYIHSDIFIDHDTCYNSAQLPRPKIGSLQRSRRDPTEVAEYDHQKKVHFFDHEIDTYLTEKFLEEQRAFLKPKRAKLVQNDDDYLKLLPFRLPAYVFRTRSFVQVDIDQVADIDKGDKARNDGFGDLVIPDAYRKLLTALVQSHSTGAIGNLGPVDVDVASTQIDIVRGKGRGLIILLHGPPGSGKTSTAETIAAYTRRPLYSITCGDLGTNPAEVEKKLHEHSTRAHGWGCVLLLDEADVFLTRRDWRDTNRNALVSVFLRQLEYYSGILFLTTNRVGVIDEAFKSRVHISLRYPRIELKQTKQIWNNILDRLERDNKAAKIQVVFDRDELLSFAEKHYMKNEEEETTWNGRQIRNAFQTAIALGHYDRHKKIRDAKPTIDGAEQSGRKRRTRVKLTRANFQNIARTAREFEEYLSNVRGADTYLAKENQLRDDTLDLSAEPVEKNYTRVSNGRASQPQQPSPGVVRRRRTPVSSGKARREGRKSSRKEDTEEEEMFDNSESDDSDSSDDSSKEDLAID